MIIEAVIVAVGLFLADGRVAHAIRRASRELRDELAGHYARNLAASASFRIPDVRGRITADELERLRRRREHEEADR